MFSIERVSHTVRNTQDHSRSPFLLGGDNRGHSKHTCGPDQVHVLLQALYSCPQQAQDQSRGAPATSGLAAAISLDEAPPAGMAEVLLSGV